MNNYAAFIDLIGPSRLKEMVFTARLMSAEQALAAGFLHEIIPAAEIGKHVREIAGKVAAHAPITLWATKEAVRRIQAARPLPDGDDIVRKVYGSDDFKEGVRAFVEKRPPRWTGK
jgi:enoyl-CoA hydratase/carnithine racemase